MVAVEASVERFDVALAEHAGQLGGNVIAVPAPGPVVIRDVARRLLEIGHEPAPLEHLRQDVRRALARQVNPAELGDRVVAVFDEHALEELLGPARARIALGRTGGRRLQTARAQELVEEEPAKRLG